LLGRRKGSPVPERFPQDEAYVFGRISEPLADQWDTNLEIFSGVPKRSLRKGRTVSDKSRHVCAMFRHDMKKKAKRALSEKIEAEKKEWESFREVNTNKDGRLACVFGMPIDDHDECQWCKAEATIRLFETISNIRRNIGAERWYFEDFIKTHGYR
jgi:inorganic triphosphatase YgiF